MKNRKILALFAGVALAGAGSVANAALVSSTSDDGNDTSLNCLFNGDSAGGPCSGTDGWIEPTSADLDVNAEAVTSDAWSIGASTGSFSKIVIEIAGNAGDNTFGIYDLSNTANRLQIFGGPNDAGDAAVVEFLGGGGYQVNFGTGGSASFSSGGIFGFYLSGPGGDFYSDNEQNAGDAEQMVAYQGDGVRKADFFGVGAATWLESEWVLAWEDLPYAGSDQDFNDFAVLVESVTTVPVPATLALLGAGLLAVAGFANRRRRDA